MNLANVHTHIFVVLKPIHQRLPILDRCFSGNGDGGITEVANEARHGILKSGEDQHFLSLVHRALYVLLRVFSLNSGQLAPS